MKRWTLSLLAFLSLVTVPTLAADYAIDEHHVFATFKVEHLGIGYVVGRFNKITGNVNLDKGQIDITLHADTVDSGHPKRDQHLKSPDFFNAKQFPKITFKSNKVTKTGKDRYRVEATITLLGKNKPVTLELKKTGEGKDPWGGYRIGLESTFTVKRGDFGMTFMADGIGNEVEMYFSGEAIRK
ncbi:YceI family protein [Acanthopleuribacter pedis]|uniref:YceI family protein n=1 Tax=Acanthopleuribacter pedis TaxID=442870 RepID=A0A8J7QI64_9BACT|nr:YceI family protein [Acanthopleuribacter pedis]MBO1322860.1 YceI family protein [Acanthopleuribacter pedis]